MHIRKKLWKQRKIIAKNSFVGNENFIKRNESKQKIDYFHLK